MKHDCVVFVAVNSKYRIYTTIELFQSVCDGAAEYLATFEGDAEVHPLIRPLNNLIIDFDVMRDCRFLPEVEVARFFLR